MEEPSMLTELAYLQSIKQLGTWRIQYEVVDGGRGTENDSDVIDSTGRYHKAC